MSTNLEQFRDPNFNPTPSSLLPQPLEDLSVHLTGNIHRKLAELDAEGVEVEVFDPEWARANSALAGEMHADVIVKTYGSTYALPNKDPVANQQAIDSGDLDVYLMKVDGETTGTTCMVNNHDGRAELGRSASLGATGASIILDYRILNWLTNEELAQKYHTLFATLRTAPNRDIDGFDMRGGQAVTAHWKKFPGLEINGFGPLYLKHGSLEQFSLASLSQATRTRMPLFVESDEARSFIEAWHAQYSDGHLADSALFTDNTSTNEAPLKFTAHYPPLESGITEFVHADVVPDEAGQPIADAIKESVEIGSPFVQVNVPIDGDTRAVQEELREKGYQIFAYQPATTAMRPTLTYGQVSPGSSVVETFWDREMSSNPFWTLPRLARHAMKVASQW